MNRNEFDEIQALVEEIAAQDHKVGAALRSLLRHVANLAGVDTSPKPASEEPTSGEVSTQSEEASTEEGNK